MIRLVGEAEAQRWEASLRSLLLAVYEALDPDHQGVQWPDPIDWDGRPLAEQARDILSLADALGREPDEVALRAKAKALRDHMDGRTS